MTIMAGNTSLGDSITGIPGGSSAVSGSENWATATQVGQITAHLIKNKTASISPLRTASSNPSAIPTASIPLCLMVHSCSGRMRSIVPHVGVGATRLQARTDRALQLPGAGKLT